MPHLNLSGKLLEQSQEYRKLPNDCIADTKVNVPLIGAPPSAGGYLLQGAIHCSAHWDLLKDDLSRSAWGAQNLKHLVLALIRR
jgi:hypothetical protein